MKGYECKKCGTELAYEQIEGMRVKREKDGKLYFHAYCPKCKEYFEEEEKTMNAFEREERCLEEQYENGELSNKEFTDQVNELYRDHRVLAHESAQRAYDDEMERW